MRLGKRIVALLHPQEASGLTRAPHTRGRSAQRFSHSFLVLHECCVVALEEILRRPRPRLRWRNLDESLSVEKHLNWSQVGRTLSHFAPRVLPACPCALAAKPNSATNLIGE